MSAIKERILGAITVMSESDAEKVWHLIADNFSDRSWSDIEEVIPDDWDKKMLTEIKNNTECREFLSETDAMKELGLV